jgi:hypothetical protein
MTNKRSPEPPRSKSLNLLGKIRNYGLVTSLSAIIAFVVGAGSTADAISKLRSFLHPEPTPLMLANNSAKSEFSRRFTQDAWERIFWMHSYTARVKRDVSSVDIDYAWTKYFESTAQWNRDLMINYQALEDYYPNEQKGQVFISEIQPEFKRIHQMLVDMRYPEAPGLRNKKPEVCPELESAIDDLNSRLFLFVTLKNESDPRAPK